MNPNATVNTRLPKIVAGVLLTLAFFSLQKPSETAQALPSKSIQSSPLTNRTYLYGETPQPNQIQNEYVVFQHQDGKVVGAIYSPQAEFNCFKGSLENKTLNVKSAELNNSKTAEAKIKLSNLHPIRAISSNDQRILSVCKKVAVKPATSNID